MILVVILRGLLLRLILVCFGRDPFLTLGAAHLGLVGLVFLLLRVLRRLERLRTWLPLARHQVGN